MPVDLLASASRVYGSTFEVLLWTFLIVSGLEITTKKLQGLASELQELVLRLATIWIKVASLIKRGK